jgi:hypothetical protein
MSTKSRVATAVAAGYVLGRFKKLRLAVMAGSALTNDSVRNAALGYVKKGSGRFGSTSAGQTLTQQVGAKLVDAGKAAALAAAASRVDSISDRLAARSSSLRGTETEEAPEGEAEPTDESESDDEEPTDEAEVEDEPTSEADELEPEDEAEDTAEDAEEEAEKPVARSRRRGRSASPGRRSGA